MNKKILVTGGAGFIGSAIIRYIIHKSFHTVCNLDKLTYAGNLESLSERVWRYHSYGYKIKKPSFYRFIKLSLKQFKFLLQRFFGNLLKFNLYFIYISLQIFLKFISLEFSKNFTLCFSYSLSEIPK